MDKARWCGFCPRILYNSGQETFGQSLSGGANTPPDIVSVQKIATFANEPNDRLLRDSPGTTIPVCAQFSGC